MTLMSCLEDVWPKLVIVEDNIAQGLVRSTS